MSDERADFDVSVVLLGGVALLMFTIYFLSTNDLRLKKYTWNVLQNTASFFIAVLICSSAGGLLKSLILTPSSPAWLAMIVNLFHLLIWLSVLTFGIAFLCGALGDTPDPAKAKETKLNMKCWGLLFGKVCSWAAIGCVGFAQQQAPRNLPTLLLLLPADVLLLCLIYAAFRALRLKLALSDDMAIDEYEKEWAKTSEDTEDAVMSVALSFQTVQVVRFWITGRLPAADGSDTALEKPESTYIWFLTLWACIFVALAVVCQLFAAAAVGKLQRNLEDAEDAPQSFKSGAGLFVSKNKKRIITVCQTTMSNCAAWCMLFFIQWWVPGIGSAGRTPAEKLAVAALVTAVSYGFIFILDKIANMEWTSEEADKELLAFIAPFSLTIAFGWKLAFTAAVNEVTLRTNLLPQAYEEFILTILISLIFVPVWRSHIVQKTLELASQDAAPPQPPPQGSGYQRMP